MKRDFSACLIHSKTFTAAAGGHLPTLWGGYKVLLATVAALFLGQMVLSNYLSTMGSRLASIQAMTTHLEEDNAILEGRLDHYNSLSSLAVNSSFQALTESPVRVVFGSVNTKVALR